ncbi:uncharacterized protein LOC120071969 [Benincasa hispida]|uniref:uncharacterized protein LOC120071969 n=1 Tax=Benincasa hispida TaxID=102211 RepID=UPI001901D27E|nr:uncharacterized protein LOC120071969 [Benincasa hispida]
MVLEGILDGFCPVLVFSEILDALWGLKNNGFFVQLLASDKLTGDNYATWKLKLNTILVIDDLQCILTKECPPIPSSNANRNVRDAYDRWIRANEKACAYILASISDVLAKKHESMSIARGIMESLHRMFG